MTMNRAGGAFLFTSGLTAYLVLFFAASERAYMWFGFVAAVIVAAGVILIVNQGKYKRG